MNRYLISTLCAFLCSSPIAHAAGATPTSSALAVAIPAAGQHELRIVAPDVLELSIAATRRDYQSRPSHCDWIDDSTHLPNAEMPAAVDLQVNGGALAIGAVGFKRSVRHAPLGGEEFVIANSLFVRLAAPLAPGAAVTVTNPAGDKWPPAFVFNASFDPDRSGPAVHVNQVGYEPGAAKRAHVGYWLGDLGELDLDAGTGFEIVRLSDGAVAFSGTLTHRPDSGYTYTPTPYQEVFEADFTALATAGCYRLRVDGLGASHPFEIRDGIAGVFARTDAAGFYHQRSGAAKTLPYTRHVDAPGHTAPAEIPSNSDRAAYNFLWDYIQNETGGVVSGPDDLLYPFVKTGTTDVSGGHHDAGDYGKYTTNSAQAVHALTFGIDHFGVGALDNLGLPESGDGIGDLLQEAKIEADFLLKMQDSDGGFFLLVRPRDRAFETDVLPSAGDVQVIYPKNTAATAAGLAALAELGSSPAFAAAFPTEAANYLNAAAAGWSFLQDAIATHGLAGSYQKLTNSGEKWGHDDELAWAAAAMYAATGEPAYQTALTDWLPVAKLTQNPADPAFGDIRDFGFKRLVEAWGCALRAYAFGHRSGRIPLAGYDAAYLAAADAELLAAADDVVAWTADTAYGAALATRFKQDSTAGYFFPVSEAFDALAGAQLAPAVAPYEDAVLQNLNYTAGNNPIDVSFTTGIGWRPQREIVSQFARNDGAILPPVGVPVGAITIGPPFLPDYRTAGGGNLLGQTLYPNTGGDVFPFYDRWSDSYDVLQEMTIPVLARSAAVTGSLFASGPLAAQAWTSEAATITGIPAQTSIGTDYVAGLATALPAADGRATWEVTALEPQHGASFTFSPSRPGSNIIAADLLMPDGRRAAASMAFNAVLDVPNPVETYAGDPGADFDVIAWYPLDGTWGDAKNLQPDLAPAGGGESFDTSSFTWSNRPGGQALRIDGAGGGASVTIPAFFLDANRATAISVEAMVMFDAYPQTSSPLLQLVKPGTFADLIWGFDQYLGAFVNGGSQPLLDDGGLEPLYAPNTWHHLKIEVMGTPFSGYRVWIDGTMVFEFATAEFSHWGIPSDAELTLGNFSGWIDEVIVRSAGTVHPPVVTLSGAETVRLRVGDPWSDPGAEATDYLDAALPVSVAGAVNTSLPGEYLLTYSATDARGETTVAIRTVSVEVAPQAGERIASYSFDGNTVDGLSRQDPLSLNGGAAVIGGELSLGGISDSASVSLPASELFEPGKSFGFAIELDIRIDAFPAGDANLLTLTLGGAPEIRLAKLAADAGASIHTENGQILAAADLGLVAGAKHHLRLVLTLDGYEIWLDGALAGSVAAPDDLTAWTGGDVTLAVGGFSGAIDQLILTNINPAVLGTTIGKLPTRTYSGLGDQKTTVVAEADLFVPGLSSGIAIEGELIVGVLDGYAVGTSKLLALEQNWDANFALARDTWSTGPAVFATFQGEIASPALLGPLFPFAQRRRAVVRLDTEGYQVWVGDRLVAQLDDPIALARWQDNGDATFTVGNLDGAILNPKVTRLEFPPETPFASWAFYNISDSNYRDETDDADSDGFTNIEEYLFGSDPDDGTSVPIIVLQQVAGRPCLDYQMSSIASAVVEGTLEESDDLRNWTPSESQAVAFDAEGDAVLMRAELPALPRKYYRLSIDTR